MDSLLTIMIIVWMLLTVTMAVWRVSDREQLPQADEALAVGAYNGTIFLLGARNHPRQLTTYDILRDRLTDHNNTLTHDVTGGNGQYWTQINHIIYMIDENNPQFNIYNMITNDLTENWSSITFNTEVGATGCLATDSQYLYVTGGRSDVFTVHNELQILNLSTYIWLTNPPSMNQSQRENHACIVYNNYLWVFGGNTTTITLTSNERISIIDITQNTWMFIDSFPVPLSMLRAAALYHSIYIIGGMDNFGKAQDVFHLVNANTGTVTLSIDSLPFTSALGAPIIVDAVLYVFGGFGGSDGKYTLSTNWADYPIPAPTHSPTPSNPTMPTTAIPSKHPTTEPSKHPSSSTIHPTTIPTSTPSHNPTVPPLSQSPTHDPTTIPSTFPSSIPTDNPNKDPSLYPTVYPTIYPSLHPTTSPSNDPSTSPSSTSPSNDPSAVPSIHPTQLPSHNPTILPSKDPSAIPSKAPIDRTLYPSSSPSNDPTMSPSENPTAPPLSTSVPSQQPTTNPSITPTQNPSFYPTLTFQITASETLYTISITVNECQNDEGECGIDQDVINNILIAYLDDVEILSTQIIDNKIVITIQLKAYDDNVLDKDVIANDIKNEMEVEYGDVDVTVTETDDESENKKQQSMYTNIAVYIAVVMVTLVIGAAIICFLCKYFGQKRTATHQENMIQMETRETPDNVANATVQTDVNLNYNTSDSISEPGAFVDDNGISEGVSGEATHIQSVSDDRKAAQTHTQDVSDDIKLDEEECNTTHTRGGIYNIAEDEFVIVGDDEEHHNTKGNDANINDEEFIVRGDDGMDYTTKGETRF